jgi:hypothetical protein
LDADEQKVGCGLCGRWFRALGGHLGPAHDWSADDYQSAFGLNAQRPLQAPAVSAAQASSLKRRVKIDRRLQAGMRKGVALARSGELNELGRQADAERADVRWSAGVALHVRANRWGGCARLASAPNATGARGRSVMRTART